MNEGSKIALPNESHTLQLGAKLVCLVEGDGALYLHGELGAGKTTLVRGMLRKLGFTGVVKSPTFSLVECYELSGQHFFHLDLYRLRQPQEWPDSGIVETLTTPSIRVIEWPSQASPFLPPPDMEIHLDFHTQNNIEGRSARFIAHSPRGQQWLNRLPT